MIYIVTGALSFIPLLLFDVQKAKGIRHAYVWFGVGGLMLLASTAMLLVPALTAVRDPWRNLFGAFAAVWLAVYLYVLFGALPAKQTYMEGQRANVVKTGPYGLCRHPGGWCFLFVYWSLYLFSGETGMLVGAILFPVLNFLYIWIQDRYLFPQYIAGYADYRREVPFLLPNRRSIAAFFNKP